MWGTHRIRRRKLSVCSSQPSLFYEVQIWVMAPKLGCVELGVKACFAFRCEKDSQPLCMLFWWANSMRSEGTRSAVSIIADKQQIARLRLALTTTKLSCTSNQACDRDTETCAMTYAGHSERFTTSVSGKMRSNMHSSLLTFALACCLPWCRKNWGTGILASSQASHMPRSQQAFSTAGCSSGSCMAGMRSDYSAPPCLTAVFTVNSSQHNTSCTKQVQAP